MLLRLVNHIIENRSAYNDAILRTVIDYIWLSHTYLASSTKNDIPFELEFSLRAALRHWTPDDLLIATALVNGRADYHFRRIGVIDELRTLIPGFNYQGFKAQVVHIALPRIYRKSPLFGIPLYHEIGHYIDHAHGVSGFAFLIASNSFDDVVRQSPHLLPTELQNHPLETKLQVLQRYLAEHFADLFAACYLGLTATDFLLDLAGHAPASASHPSVDDRLRVVSAFTSGQSDGVVGLFQRVLASIGLPTLQPRFTVPDITSDYSHVRPYVIQTDEELHGLYTAAYRYLKEGLDNRPPAWEESSEKQVIAAVNDLTEKSIRNFAIKQDWAHATS